MTFPIKIGILTSHPIQYHAPLFKELSKTYNVHVYFAHKATAKDQAKSGFGTEFEWDIDLLNGYSYEFLKNRSKNPTCEYFFGCDTPDIKDEIEKKQYSIFIVMGWNLFCYWQAIMKCKQKKIPIYVRGDSQLLTPRSFLKTAIKKVIYPMMLKFFDGFLVVGKRNAEYLKCYGVPAKKMFFCPHFVDNERFYQDSRLSEEEILNKKSQLGLDQKIPTILFVGKLILKKRPMDLLRAVTMLKKQNLFVQILFVGSGSLQSKIEKIAREENIRVVFAGFINQKKIPQYYAISDLLVLPSDGGETWGLVVNEAMACGLPAIVSDQVGCGPDLIEDRKTGFIFPVGNSKKLADSIKELMLARFKYKNSKALKEKMNEYSLEAHLKGIRQILSFEQQRLLDAV